MEKSREQTTLIDILFHPVGPELESLLLKQNLRWILSIVGSPEKLHPSAAREKWTRKAHFGSLSSCHNNPALALNLKWYKMFFNSVYPPLRCFPSENHFILMLFRPSKNLPRASEWMECNKTDGYYYWQRTMELFLDVMEKRTQCSVFVDILFAGYLLH